MNGVTILNSYEYLTNTDDIMALVFLFAMFFAGSIIVLVDLVIHKWKSWIESIIFIVCITLTITCVGLVPEKKYETRYQVTTDDSVSINEFQNKYEIIEVEGKIYTVRERIK